MPQTWRWRAALVAAGGLICCAGMAYLYFFAEQGSGIPCVLNRLTGLYCAGCGTSRALYSLLHFEWYQAFRYNPLLVLLVPFFVWYGVLTVVQYIKTGVVYIAGKKVYRFVLIIAVTVVVYSIARNIPIFPFDLLRPTVV